jgi:hypothetical protein
MKKRNAKWGTCEWCVKREIVPPYMSGKKKCLVRHMVKCEAAYRLQHMTNDRNSCAMLGEMVKILQEQVASLTARVTTLEIQKEKYMHRITQHWAKITPKSAWINAKVYLKRAICACLSRFEPSKYVKTHYEYLEFHLLTESPELHDILSICLFPVTMECDGKIILKNMTSTDYHYIFKKLWGKSSVPNLNFIKEVFDEIGLPERFYAKSHYCEINDEFMRLVQRFQDTPPARADEGLKYLPHGLVGLVRVWKRMYCLPDDLLTVCTSLAPTECLAWGT